MSYAFRCASPVDAEAIREIYLPWVTDAAVAFEWTPPSVNEIRHRIESKEEFPWLVCEFDGDVIGYTTARSHRSGSAYQWAAESAIYVDQEFQREGIGRALYTMLFDLLRRQGYQKVLAIVTVPNESSAAFHREMGFKPIGVVDNAGYKGGEWHDQQWFQRSLTDECPDLHPETPISPDELDDDAWQSACDVAHEVLPR